MKIDDTGKFGHHSHYSATAMIRVAGGIFPAINDLIRLQTRPSAASPCFFSRTGDKFHAALAPFNRLNSRKKRQRCGAGGRLCLSTRGRGGQQRVRALAGRGTRASASTVLGVQHALLPSVSISRCQRPFPRLQIRSRCRRRFKCSAFVLANTPVLTRPPSPQK